MKVILQDYEPKLRPFGETETRKPVVRKSRIALNLAQPEFRLFHAL